MKKSGLLTILILFTLFMFSSTAFASDTKDYKFKTYKQGKLEITSNLPDEIDPTIVGKITDKNGNEKEAEGKVKHTLKRVYKDGNQDVYDVQTEVSIQAIMGPYSDNGSDQDPYSHMYQKQTMDWFLL